MMDEVGAGRRQPAPRVRDRRNHLRAAARQVALTRLSKLYPEAYAEIYQEELDKLGVGDRRRPGRYSKRDREVRD